MDGRAGGQWLSAVGRRGRRPRRQRPQAEGGGPGAGRLRELGRLGEGPHLRAEDPARLQVRPTLGEAEAGVSPVRFSAS